MAKEFNTNTMSEAEIFILSESNIPRIRRYLSSLRSIYKEIPDPRDPRGKKFALDYVLSLYTIGVLTHHTSCSSARNFIDQNKDLFSAYFPKIITKGISSEDCFCACLAAVSKKQMEPTNRISRGNFKFFGSIIFYVGLAVNGQALFYKDEIIRISDYEEKYNELSEENTLLFTLDQIKEKLLEAYQYTEEPKMAELIIYIMNICLETENSYLLWFKQLLDKHIEEISAHATYNISNSKLESINNRIKTLRRRAIA